jgi:hypothetical protein
VQANFDHLHVGQEFLEERTARVLLGNGISEQSDRLFIRNRLAALCEKYKFLITDITI